jgi:UDP-glucose 4-epimerase
MGGTTLPAEVSTLILLTTQADDFAGEVRELAGSCSPIHYIPYDQAYEAGFEDMPRRVPDISKIRQFVGYEPKMQLDDIIRIVIEHMRAN